MKSVAAHVVTVHEGWKTRNHRKIWYCGKVFIFSHVIQKPMLLVFSEWFVDSNSTSMY